MNKLIRFMWAAVALIIAFSLAAPLLMEALKVLLIVVFVVLPIIGVVYLVRLFTGGNRMIR
ncbi:hypothetical protein AB0H71_28800 [Nocardia sp. NPDC050697]|uniref:hypothetical protein n=1 Tax=Nocardia sp. NPDC050697 TaxID=3155158 RepID=UPI0033C5A03E